MRTFAVVVSALSIALPATGQTAPPAAVVTRTVRVPPSGASYPFNTVRTLLLPPGFDIAVYARLLQPRFMAVAPNNDLFVSETGAGRIVIVRDVAGSAKTYIYASGLRRPHDMVFKLVGSTTYLYVTESNQISRYVYAIGDTIAPAKHVIIGNLPDASSAGLNGAYGHQLKNIAIGADDKLYLAIASATNSSPTDTTSNPVRCAIYQYNLDGTGRRLFASGLRNAEGLAFLPGTNTLWVTVNHRDNILYPYHQDWDGDGLDDYGKVMQSYVNNHPPDGFTSVRDGANYGWPFANANPDTVAGLANMPFDFDVQNNPNWSVHPPTAFTTLDRGIPAHSAPLGFSFLQGTLAPPAYRPGAVVALHGSWNRSTKTGYKLIYFPWGATMPGNAINLVTGWVDSVTQSVWGRPVDVVPDLNGDLLISDDYSGTIYKLTSTSLASLALDATSVVAGQALLGTVTLAEAAPSGGTVVGVASSNPAVAGVPAALTVPAGATTARFSISAKSVPSDSVVTIRASTGGVTRTVALTVRTSLGFISLNPTVLVGAGTTTGTVALAAPAPAGGRVVTLTSSSGAVVVPASIVIPAGATSRTFTVSASAVSANTVVTITATADGASKIAYLTLRPWIASLTLAPSTVAGGGSMSGKVILNAPAPAGGALVALASNNAVAAVPAWVNVPAGGTVGTFAATTRSVTANTTVTFSASFRQSTKQAVAIVVPN